MILIMLDTPNRDRLAERREATRAEILEAAWMIARTEGLSAITLKDIGQLVGMKAPSLYSHFPSKAAIYDAMFAQAWTQCREAMAEAVQQAPQGTRDRLKFVNRAFVDFCLANPARHQLMNTRAVPGFTPSPPAYQPAVETLETAKSQLRLVGVTGAEDVDLMIAMVGGLIESQLANDPGGDRWTRLLDRAIDMFANDVGLPAD
jgi:AcrR family transcriptional regulator